jgi:predicted ABC-type transport system involved in lysophospholipase L1 biosynthesis ATPase subunit
MSGTPVLQIANVRKNYQGLRPLRLRELVIMPGEQVAVSGFDAGAAEVLVNLVTGASLPDEGEVRVLGHSTAEVTEGDDWLASLDRFGIVSPRAVLLDAVSALQNLAMPFTLQIDPIPPDVADRALALAADAGIPQDRLHDPVAALSSDLRMRIHLARAIALDPALLILEHPTATLPRVAAGPFGRMVQSITTGRRAAALIISEDAAFSEAAASRRLALKGATGELKPVRRGWFAR